MTKGWGVREIGMKTKDAKPEGHSDAENEGTSDVLERIAVMRRREIGLYQYVRYRVHAPRPTSEEARQKEHTKREAEPRSPTQTPGIQIRNGPLREAICEWCYGVVDRLGLSRETVATTILLLDRYLATVPKTKSLSSRTVHLTAFVILHISIKTHEMGRVNVTELATLAQEQPFLDIREFTLMEAEILFGLRWYLHPPTAASFVRELVFLLLPLTATSPQATATSPSSAGHDFDAEADAIKRTLRDDIYERAIYLTELAVCDSFFIEHDSSTVAIAAILNVLDNHTHGHQNAGNFAESTSPLDSAMLRRDLLSPPIVQSFLAHVEAGLQLICEGHGVTDARSRLRDIYEANLRTSMTQDDPSDSAHAHEDTLARPDVATAEKVFVQTAPPPDHADRSRAPAVATAPVPAPPAVPSSSATTVVSHAGDSRKKHHRKSNSLTLGLLNGHRSPDCIVAAVTGSSSPHPLGQGTSNGRMTW